MSTNKLDLFYPDAINWMWYYCTNLGKFTDSNGNNYDLGVHVSRDEVSAAIVFDNEPGEYYSGDLVTMCSIGCSHPRHEAYRETYKRAKESGLIN